MPIQPQYPWTAGQYANTSIMSLDRCTVRQYNHNITGPLYSTAIQPQYRWTAVQYLNTTTISLDRWTVRQKNTISQDRCTVRQYNRNITGPLDNTIKSQYHWTVEQYAKKTQYHRTVVQYANTTTISLDRWTIQ